MTHPIAQQHRRLRLLLEETRAAIGDRDAATAQAVFERLRTALETHFEQEGRLYYPTIGALRPDFKPSLARFLAAHDEFRARFDAISAALGSGEFEGAERTFDDFTEAFARHEAGEEDLLRSLDAELASAR